MNHQPSISFYWQTKLPPARQLEINAWVASLSDAERSMLADAIDDAREAERWEAGYEAARGED